MSGWTIFFPNIKKIGFSERRYWTQNLWFWFSLQLSSETFLILRRIRRDIIRMFIGLHVRRMKGPTLSREMFSCSAIDLAEIRRSSKISSWIWLIISRVVTVLGRPGRSASQMEKSPRLVWATRFLTVAHDGACSPNVSFRMTWISFGALPCREKNLMTARVSMLLKSRASPDMLPFSVCNKDRLAIRHKNRHLFPTKISIPSYDFRN